VERPEPDVDVDERTSLAQYLDLQRATLLWKAEGLGVAALDRRHEPSALTLGGLLKHLALVEDNWFSVVLKGRPDVAPWDAIDWDDDPDWEWRTGATDGPEALMSLYEETVDRVRRITDETIAAEGLDALSVKTSRRGEGAFSLRWILLHMIEEYARHNGHADLLRESIDGQVGE
jgi:uncharacterized damage-inducible protein DinB